MRIKLLFCLLFLASSSFAQIPGLQQSKTYALIIGISDYDDPKISDLNFSDNDADAFADYLRSSAGGFVPEENIVLLTNQMATKGAIENELWKLGNKVRNNDLVFFYFSGHGDVEVDTIYNKGYLLAWDTPHHNYRNNAVSLERLNEEAARMSINKKAKVIYILDACRSGELAGQANQGRLLANDQLKRRFAKELRIMSCEPDQESLESSLIGEGRGLFSYYLIKGLKGLAERSGRKSDLQITARELRNYLEDEVGDFANAAFDTDQDPLIEGDRDFRIAIVDEDILAAEKVKDSQEQNNNTSFAIAASKGGSGSKFSKERIVIEAIRHSGIIEHPDFVDKVVSKKRDFYSFLRDSIQKPIYLSKLDSLEQQSLKQFFEESKDLIRDEAWQQKMNIQLALLMHDLAQQGINAYLRADLEELRIREEMMDGEGYTIYPTLIKESMSRLGEDHPLYKSLEIKYHYLLGVVKRLKADKVENDQEKFQLRMSGIEDVKKALQLDSASAYIYNELGILYFKLGEDELSDKHLWKAIELAPTWALPYYNLGLLYLDLEDYEKAQFGSAMAINLQPQLADAYMNVAVSLYHQGELLKAEDAFRKFIKLDDSGYLSYQNLGLCYLAANEYILADSFFTIADIRKGKEIAMAFVPPYVVPGTTMGTEIAIMEADSAIINLDANCNGNIEQSIIETAENNPNDASALFALAEAFFENQCYTKAFKNYEKIILLNDKHLEAYKRLSQISKMKQDHEAQFQYNLKIVSLDDQDIESYFELGDLSKDVFNRLEEAIEFYVAGLSVNGQGNQRVDQILGELFYNKKEYQKAAFFYERAFKAWRYSDGNQKIAYEIGVLYQDWGHFDQAEFYFKNYLEFADDYSEKIKTQTRLYEVYRSQGRYEEAEAMLLKYANVPDLVSFYQELVKQLPNHPHWKYQLANLGFVRTNSDRSNKILVSETVRCFKMLQEAHPAFETSSEVLFKMGQLYAWADSASLSAEYFERAIESDSNNMSAASRAAQVLLNDGQRFDALKYLEILNRADKINFKHQVQLAKLLCLSRNFSLAEKTLADAEQIFPGNSKDILNTYGILYLLSNQAEKAIQKYTVLHELANDEGYAAYSIARIYTQQNKLDMALMWLRKAFEQGFEKKRIISYDLLMHELSDQKESEFNALMDEFKMAKFN